LRSRIALSVNRGNFSNEPLVLCASHWGSIYEQYIGEDHVTVDAQAHILEPAKLAQQDGAWLAGKGNVDALRRDLAKRDSRYHQDTP
jgi:hypothetical protein